MARTPQQKLRTQIRDITDVRALLKNAAAIPASPAFKPTAAKLSTPATLQPPTLPKKPAAPLTNFAPPAAPLTFAAPKAPPAIPAAPPAQLNTAPPASPAVSAAPPGEPAPVPPAVASPPLNTAGTGSQAQVAAPAQAAQTAANQAQSPQAQSTQAVTQPAAGSNKQLEADFAGISKEFQSAKTPEAQMAAVKKAAPLFEKYLDKAALGQHAKALSDLKAGQVNTPDVARLMQEKVGPAGEKFVTDFVARSGASDPYSFGAAANKASELWGSLGTYGQIAFGLGVPLSLIGMFGNSGMASILGLLGLGVAGGAATLGGAFGEEPAKLVENLLGSAAQTAGISTPSRAQYEQRLRDASAISQSAADSEMQKIVQELEAKKIFPSARAALSEIGPNHQQFVFDKARAAAADRMGGVQKAYNAVTPDWLQVLPGLARAGISRLPENLRGMVPKQIDTAIDGANKLLNPTPLRLGDAYMQHIKGWKNPAEAASDNPAGAGEDGALLGRL